MVVPRIPTKVARYLLDHSMCGITVERKTIFQFGWTRKAVITYANNTRVSHLKIRTIFLYKVQNNNEVMTVAKTGVQISELTPVIICDAAAIPPRSAPMLKTFATINSTQALHRVQRG